MLLKICPELRGQHPLFSPRLNPIADNDQTDSGYTSPSVNRDRGTNCSQIQSGINGMPQPRIRPGADQFVIFFDGDPCAPKLSEMPARPQGQRNPGPGERDAREAEGVSPRGDFVPENPDVGNAA